MYFVTKSKYLLTTIILLVLTGCYSIGPKQIHLDRNRYNDAIHQTTDEQLLTNIVRLRYVESTAFLKLSNVTSSYNINENSGASSGVGLAYLTGTISGSPISNVTRSLSLTPQLSYSDTPTITYLPVDDSEFVNQLMTPINLQQLQLLFSGGIDDPRTLLRLIISNVNNLDNASLASSAKFNGIPKYRQFYEFLRLAQYAVDNNEAILYPEKLNGNFVLVLHFYNKYGHSNVAYTAKKILDISSSNNDIIFTDIYNSQKNLATIRMRSIYGIMTYMSYGIQIPESDKKAGYVYVHHNSDGSEFDWRPLTENLFTVYSSDNEPSDVFVKVYLHGHWFYIKQNDLDSKASFTLLTRLITLTAGKNLGGGPGPTLTLPIGR